MKVLDAVVIGGGHCGINMAEVLQQNEKNFVVLEKNRVFESWRSNRWDNFQMNMPQKFHRMLGQVDDIDDYEMGLTAVEGVEIWSQHVVEHGYPVREHCLVTSVTLNEDGTFAIVVESQDGGPVEYTTRNVINACGEHLVPYVVQSISEMIPDDVLQLKPGTYKSASSFQEGGVLVIGGGQTGIQITQMLVDDGLDVHVATSKIGACPRNYCGKDLFQILEGMQFLSLPREHMPNPAMKYASAPITGSVRAISHSSLARQGVKFYGRVNGFENGNVIFEDDLNENVQSAVDSYAGFIGMFHGFRENNPDFFEEEYVPESEWELHSPLIEEPGVTTLNLEENNITNVLWATGWKPDFSYLKIDSILDDFDQISNLPQEMKSIIPGVFWIGFPWLSTFASNTVLGAKGDAVSIGELLL